MNRSKNGRHLLKQNNYWRAEWINDYVHSLKNERGTDHGTSRRVIEDAGGKCVAARIAAHDRRGFGRRGTQHAGHQYRLGRQAGPVHRFLPLVSHQE
jgi:hypothetical protein